MVLTPPLPKKIFNYFLLLTTSGSSDNISAKTEEDGGVAAWQRRCRFSCHPPTLLYKSAAPSTFTSVKANVILLEVSI